MEKIIDEIIDEVVSYTEKVKAKEKVNHPSHYNVGIETIDYIESWSMNFNIGNVIKYTTRAGYKENKMEDLFKAKWYIEREIKRVENEINGNN
jgi:hypothetical protein